MIDVFREVREHISAEEAARFYGLEFDRRGWAVCPFHQDRHPSMSFRAGRFRCWACNAAGDAVDLTGRLLGLEPLAAAERLNADFCLGLPLHRKPTPAEAEAVRRRMEVKKAHEAFEAWKKSFVSRLCEAFRIAHVALRDVTDLDKLTEGEALATQIGRAHV